MKPLTDREVKTLNGYTESLDDLEALEARGLVETVSESAGLIRMRISALGLLTVEATRRARGAT